MNVNKRNLRFSLHLIHYNLQAYALLPPPPPPPPHTHTPQVLCRSFRSSSTDSLFNHESTKREKTHGSTAGLESLDVCCGGRTLYPGTIPLRFEPGCSRRVGLFLLTTRFQLWSLLLCGISKRYSS